MRGERDDGAPARSERGKRWRERARCKAAKEERDGREQRRAKEREERGTRRSNCGVESDDQTLMVLSESVFTEHP